MCGLAGLVRDSPVETQRKSVKQMLHLMGHRGPDDEGVWQGDGVCLGHRRLSIIDLSPRGHQPMVDDSGHLALVYNGEIYNYLELRSELEREGCVFRSRSDTEVLLLGYRQWGKGVLKRLKGFFSFALWDARTKSLFCARDPLGKKPFYYCLTANRFVFASEVEALIGGLGSRPEIDFSQLSHYLWTGYFAPGTSIYKSVRVLRPGHALEVSRDLETVREWPHSEVRFSFDVGGSEDYKAFLMNCEGLFGRAVCRRLQSDVPVGVLLSGGVDSSLVAMVAAEQSQTPIRTFTASFRSAGFDEAPYADRVARHVSSIHSITEVGMEDVPAILPRLVEAYGEPFGDESALPCYSIFGAIKPPVKVVLTGDGGDEAFGGYKDAKLFLLRSKLDKLVGLGDWIHGGILASLLGSDSSLLRKLGYGGMALRNDGARAFCSLIRGGWTLEYRRRFFRREIWKRTGEGEVENEVRRRFSNSGGSDLERYLNMTLERLTQCYLVKIDRASMAHSIEARSPFLDGDLLDKATGSTPGLLFRGGANKPVLKDLLGRRIGEKFSRRPKMGFSPPLGDWLREPQSAAWVESRLTGKDSFAYQLVEPSRIRSLLQLQRRGEDHTGRLWKLLFLNEWFTRFYGSERVSTDAPVMEGRAHGKA